MFIFGSTVTDGKFIRNSTFVRGSNNVYHGNGDNCILLSCQGSSCCPKIEQCIAYCEAGTCYEVSGYEVHKDFHFQDNIMHHFNRIIDEPIIGFLGNLLS